MPRLPNSDNNNNKQFINIICDETLLKQYERLGLTSGTKLSNDLENNNNNNNNNLPLSQQSAGSNTSNNEKSADSVLSCTCEDIGMEKAAVITATRNRPYKQNASIVLLNSEILCVISILTHDQLRQLYAKGMLFRFLRDGLKVIHRKYDVSFQQQKNNINNATPVFYSPKVFLVIEYPRNVQQDPLDLGIVADLLLFQTTCVGACHVSFCNSPPQTPTSQMRDEIAAFIQAVGQYLVRKAAVAPSEKSTSSTHSSPVPPGPFSSGVSSKIRDRDDTLLLLEPQYLQKGKIAPEDWAAAYKAILCEIEGLTATKAVEIIARFPTLKSLLSAIDSKDQIKLAILADTVGGNGPNRMGDAIVQKIIDKMSKTFDERTAFEKTARDFL